jgi:hypothetical protein
MWNILKAVWQLAGALGIGATIQNWFFDDDNEAPPDNSIAGMFKGFIPLLVAAAVVLAVYRLLGKKIKIG